MEVQLQELVEKIKKDGVDQAEAQAKDIVKDAEAQAATIIKNAQTEAENIVNKSKEEAEKLESAAISAITQAGRNLILTFKDSLLNQVDAVIQTETTKVYDEHLLKTLVPQVVTAWVNTTKTKELDVLLSSDDTEKLQSYILKNLQSDISKGIEIKADKSIAAGFRIATKDGAAYYDFSAEAVASLFSEYLNPRVAEILQTAAKEL